MLRVCLQSASTYLQRSFLLLVTAAPDLLVHKILLNSVLPSPIVSDGVRPKLPGQTPLGHNSPCFLPLGSVGVKTPPCGSDRVRSTGQCQFSRKIPAGFCLTMSYAKKIAVFTYCSPHFCFPWRRPCEYHAICCGMERQFNACQTPRSMSSIVSELYDA